MARTALTAMCIRAHNARGQPSTGATSPEVCRDANVLVLPADRVRVFASPKAFADHHTDPDSPAPYTSWAGPKGLK